MDYDFDENDDDIFNDIEDAYLAPLAGILDDQPGEVHLNVLKEKFGHSKFRPMQWKVIKSIIEDGKDNCVIMATGYGKSLCYQYPAVFSNKITLVVSPLISLMEDQVLALNLANISACFLGSAQANKYITTDIYQGCYSIVYVTPEYITGPGGETLLKGIEQRLVLIGIDEAHCVSQWGHDFRPAYRNLAIIRATVPRVPMLAVTATATPDVQDDITKSLRLRNPNVLCTGFDRPNLQFFVRIKSTSVWNDLKLLLLTHNSGSAIIYCITRKITEEIAELLKMKGLKCEAYHAGLSINKRRDVHESFVKDKIHIIVATIAFGMGIDKPDVRLVIHYGCSKNMESYYQEVGRAGRDGGLSKCLTFYNRQDLKLHATLRENYSYASQAVKNNQAKLSEKMYEYLNTTGCRRNFILKYFEGENFVRRNTKKNCCDNCVKKNSSYAGDDQIYEEIDKDGKVDLTSDAKLLLNALDAFNGKTGLGFPILLLRGSRVKRLNERYYTHPLHGKGKDKPEEWWKILAILLEHQSFIKKVSILARGAFANVHTLMITQEGYKWLANTDDHPLKLEPPKDMFPFLKKKKITPEFVTSYNPLGPQKTNLLAASSTSATTVPKRDHELELSHKIRLALLKTRGDLAADIDAMPYMIASNVALTQLSKLRPTTIEALRDCKLDGFSETKINKFGAAFIDSIREALKSAESENTMEAILAENPIPGTKMTASRQNAYDHFMSGKSITNIANSLNIQTSTVFTYLSECIRYDLQFTRNDFKKCGISDEIFESITSKIPANSLFTTLKDLKEQFPLYTYDMLRLVTSYHQVRQHIKNLNIPFDDPDAIKPATTAEAPKTFTATVAPEVRNQNSGADLGNDELFSDDEDISFEELDKIVLTANSTGKPDEKKDANDYNEPCVQDSMPDDDIIDLENEILKEMEHHNKIESLKAVSTFVDDDDTTDDELPEYYLNGIEKVKTNNNTAVKEDEPKPAASVTTIVTPSKQKSIRDYVQSSPKTSQNSSPQSSQSGASSNPAHSTPSKFMLKRRTVPNKKVMYEDSEDEDKPPPPKMTTKRNMPAWLCNGGNTLGSNEKTAAPAKKPKSSIF